jgi:predicted MFS family arabinose efflux permease
MTATLQPPKSKIPSLSTVRQRNKHYVYIDGIGVGIASAAAPFLPVFLTRLGATPLQVGLLTSMPGITGLILVLWVGRFLQKQSNVIPWYSLPRFLVISAYGLTGFVPFFVKDSLLIPVILVIWAVATVPQTIVSVSFSVVMNAVSGPEGRYELMSRRWSILGLTTAVTVAIAGQVLDRLDFHLNYQLVFLALSLGGLLSYYFSSRIRLQDLDPTQKPATPGTKSSFKKDFRRIRNEPNFISITLKQFVYLFGITLGTPLFPLYFVRQVDASDAWIGLLYTAQAVVLVVGYFFWAKQSHHIGSRYVLLIATLGLSLYPGMVALTKNQTMIFAFAAVAGIFQAGVDLVFFDELMKTIPSSYSPTFVSLAQAIQYLSAVLAPLTGTFLAEHIGLSHALLCSAGVRLLGFALFSLQNLPRIKRKSVLAGASLGEKSPK